MFFFWQNVCMITGSLNRLSGLTVYDYKIKYKVSVYNNKDESVNLIRPLLSQNKTDS